MTEPARHAGPRLTCPACLQYVCSGQSGPAAGLCPCACHRDDGPAGHYRTTPKWPHGLGIDLGIERIVTSNFLCRCQFCPGLFVEQWENWRACNHHASVIQARRLIGWDS